ncbi:5-bromo-4-chloroindolyl phosphate hydrolysis family protein [Aerococcus urinaehominis]|nr:5-bromo-4-chloroindolyl phosphate hydrolysis family protein [Aerococcus urinaehominis]
MLATVILFICLISMTSWQTSLGLIAIIWLLLWGYQAKNKQAPSKKLSARRYDFYRSQGLTNRDIHVYRQQMQVSLDKINQVLNFQSSDPRVKAVFNHWQIKKLLKQYFKAINRAPKRLDQASRFIFKDLDQLVHLIDNYQQVDSDILKRTNYQKQQSLIAGIDEIASHIHQDYQDFINLDKEIHYDQIRK